MGVLRTLGDGFRDALMLWAAILAAPFRVTWAFVRHERRQFRQAH